MPHGSGNKVVFGYKRLSDPCNQSKSGDIYGFILDPRFPPSPYWSKASYIWPPHSWPPRNKEALGTFVAYLETRINNAAGCRGTSASTLYVLLSI